MEKLALAMVNVQQYIFIHKEKVYSIFRASGKWGVFEIPPGGYGISLQITGVSPEDVAKKIIDQVTLLEY